MGCDQFEPYGFPSCLLHNWSTRVVGSGERAQAPKSGTGPYSGPETLAYGPQPKHPVSPRDKLKIARYFIMSDLNSSPQRPAFTMVIYAEKSVRRPTLQNFWMPLWRQAHSLASAPWPK